MRLELARNKIATLPPGIGSLRKLQILDLSRNTLQALPTEIGLRLLAASAERFGKIHKICRGFSAQQPVNVGGH
jgi:Leucine-rich repeat (LRR) protein